MITSQVETITPDKARALLEVNIENRTVRKNIAEQYASDMASGIWKVNGEPIIIDENGQLIDGQHRLHAVLLSGATIEVLVVRGVNREHRDTIDVGAIRRSGDILQMFHIPNGNSVAAIARMIIAIERAKYKSCGNPSIVSKIEVIERCKVDERLIFSDRMAHTCKSIARRNAVAVSRYLIPDSRLSNEFFTKLADGTELYHGHPIYSLRNWLFRNGGTKISNAQTIEAIIRAWISFKEGRELSRMQIMGDLPPNMIAKIGGVA
jgi:hypothetical protein